MPHSDAIQIKIGDQVMNALATHEQDLGNAFLVYLDRNADENRRLPPLEDFPLLVY